MNSVELKYELTNIACVAVVIATFLAKQQNYYSALALAVVIQIGITIWYKQFHDKEISKMRSGYYLVILWFAGLIVYAKGDLSTICGIITLLLFTKILIYHIMPRDGNWKFNMGDWKQHVTYKEVEKIVKVPVVKIEKDPALEAELSIQKDIIAAKNKELRDKQREINVLNSKLTAAQNTTLGQVAFDATKEENIANYAEEVEQRYPHMSKEIKQQAVRCMQNYDATVRNRQNIPASIVVDYGKLVENAVCYMLRKRKLLDDNEYDHHKNYFDIIKDFIFPADYLVYEEDVPWRSDASDSDFAATLHDIRKIRNKYAHEIKKVDFCMIKDLHETIFKCEGVYAERGILAHIEDYL